MIKLGIKFYHSTFSSRVCLLMTVTIMSSGERRGIEPLKLRVKHNTSADDK